MSPLVTFLLLSISSFVASAPTTTTSPSEKSTALSPSDPECQSLLAKSDSCIRKAFLFGDPNAKFPSSDSDMDHYCFLGQEYTSCVKSYGKCLKPFPRQILYLLIGNMKKLMKDTCDTKSGREGELQEEVERGRDE